MIKKTNMSKYEQIPSISTEHVTDHIPHWQKNNNNKDVPSVSGQILLTLAEKEVPKLFYYVCPQQASVIKKKKKRRTSM